MTSSASTCPSRRQPAVVAVPEWAEMRATRFVRVPRPPLFRGTPCSTSEDDPHAAVLGYWPRVRLRRRAGPAADTRRALAAVQRRHQGARGETWGTDRWDGLVPALASQYLHEAFHDEVPEWLLPRWTATHRPTMLRINDIHQSFAAPAYRWACVRAGA